MPAARLIGTRHYPAVTKYSHARDPRTRGLSCGSIAKPAGPLQVGHFSPQHRHRTSFGTFGSETEFRLIRSFARKRSVQEEMGRRAGVRNDIRELVNRMRDNFERADNFKSARQTFIAPKYPR